MCYKYMWDNLVADNFPSKEFFTYFGLNPQSILCEDLRVLSADSGFSATVSRGDYFFLYVVVIKFFSVSGII